ncbi:DUF748 domain-containing protein [Alcanivorax sp. 24]|uniref:DUF748 domain-containing protein n=1 Tax=Alcanivorax sp. 24 TaxID=2545266 RepID=UPI00105E22AD|nr:DUF748 domain-containing protein [Alcanivorax sp. 24]
MDTPLQWWRRQGWGRRTVVICLFLYVLYLVVVGLILPGWLRGKAEQELSSLLGRTVTVEKVSLNPFVLSATVEGFDIADDRTETLLGFQRLFVNAQFWSSLFHWRPWVREISLDGLDAGLWRGQGGELSIDDILARLSQPAAGTDDAGADGADTDSPDTDSPDTVATDEPEPPEQEQPEQQQEPLVAETTPASETEAASQQESQVPALTVDVLQLTAGRVRFIDATGEEPVTLTLPVEFKVEDLTTRAPEQEDNRYALNIEGPDGGTLEWSGRFNLQPLSTDGRLSMAQVDLVSFAQLLRSQFDFRIPSGHLALSADYRFSAEQGQGLTVRNGTLELDNLVIRRAGQEDANLTLPRIAVNGVSLDTVSREVTVPEVRISEAVVNAELDQEGLDLATLFLPRNPAEEEQENAEDSAVEPWRVALQTLVLEQAQLTLLDKTVSPATPVAFTNTNLTVTDVTVGDQISWHWQGDAVLAESGRLNHSGEGSLSPLNISAAIKADAVPLPTFAPWVKQAVPITIRRGQASADLKVDVAGEEPVVTVSGGAGLNNLDLLEGNGQSFAKLASLQASGVSVNTAEHRATVANIDVSGLDLINRVDAQGRDLVSRLNTGGGGGGGGDAGGPAWRVGLKQVRVKNSKLAHNDASLSKPFAISLEQWNSTVRNFDTGGGRAAITLNGKVNGNAPLKAEGSVSPDPLFLDLKMDFQSYGMEGLTPYTGRFLGYAVRRGLLSVNSTVKIENNQLESRSTVAADRFFLGDRVQSDEAVNAPVRLGLSVLRDSSGMINLPLNVSGDMNDPSFSVTGLIFTVIKNVLVKAATAPFSLLSSLAGGKDLEQIAFPAGDALPGAETRQNLATLNDVLSKRPGLSVVLSGQTNDEDRAAFARQALGEQLSEGMFRGDWPGEQAALADHRWGKRIVKEFEKRFDADSAELGVEGRDDAADARRARLAWERLVEAAAKDVSAQTLRTLATQRAENARNELVEQHGLDAGRVRLGDPAMDGKLAGIQLGLGND